VVIERKSSRSVDAKKRWNAVNAGCRMSSSPRPVKCDTAPATCASWKVMSASSTKKFVSGPPRAVTFPVSFPCQSAGNGLPFSVRSRSQSTGSAFMRTSCTLSTGPPVSKVMSPTSRDLVVRTSMFVMA